MCSLHMLGNLKPFQMLFPGSWAFTLSFVSAGLNDTMRAPYFAPNYTFTVLHTQLKNKTKQTKKPTVSVLQTYALHPIAIILRCYLHQGQLVTHFSGNTYAKVTVPYKVLLRTPGTNGNYDFHYCHLSWGFEIGWGACWEPHFSTLWRWYRLPGYLLSSQCTLNSSVNPSEIVHACCRLSVHTLKLYAGDTTGLQFTS